MKKHIFTSLLTFFTLTFCLSQTPQDTVKPLLIVAELKQGSTIQGRLIERRGDTIIIDADKLGRIKLPMSDIKSIEEVGNAKERKLLFEPRMTNKYANRALLAPTAIDNGKGVGEYTNYYIFVNHLSGGISDNVRLGGGIIMVPSDEFVLVGFASAKLTYSINDDFHIGAGGLAGGVLSPTGDGGGILSMVYGVSTLGNKDKNLTLGIGGFHADGDWQSKPVIMLNGQYRVANNWSLSGEFYSFKRDNFFQTRATTFIIGAKYFTPRVAINFGFSTFNSLFGNNISIPIPILSVSAPLDKKQRNKLK